MTYQTHTLWRHAVEFDIYPPPTILFRIQNYGLDGNGEIKVDDLEWSIKDISFQVARKLLSDHEIHHFWFLVLLIRDSFVLFEENRFLSGKLKHDSFVTFPHELVHDVSFEVAVVEGEEESAGNSAFESFYVDWDKLSDFETNIARKVEKCSWWFFLLQNLICGELWDNLFPQVFYQLRFHGDVYLSEYIL